jgi:hypothetical protein
MHVVRDARATAFRACRQQGFAVMTGRAAEAGQGLMPHQ